MITSGSWQIVWIKKAYVSQLNILSYKLN